jgi:hypothetical protein
VEIARESEGGEAPREETAAAATSAGVLAREIGESWGEGREGGMDAQCEHGGRTCKCVEREWSGWRRREIWRAWWGGYPVSARGGI